MKIEAKDLQSALTQATKELNCSVIDLEYSVLQHHNKGFLGLFKKNAIIEVRSKKKPYNKFEKNIKRKEKEEKASFNKSEKNPKTEEYTQETLKEKQRLQTPQYKVATESIFENFHKESEEKIDPSIFLDEIKLDLEHLLKTAQFNIQITQLRLWNEESIYIKLDGEDAALLIGKEAYRYKALSYLLHNWINAKYKLFVRLEIAEFLKNQEQGMDFYLKNIIEKIQATGKGQTKYLDGVLVKIALEKLRAAFPDKYVGIKQNGEQKFIIVNDFFKKDE